MAEESIRTLKWFWPWQDRELEEWLRQMSLKGWHVTAARGLSYTFEGGEPQDVVYRLDW